tara:strand:+ start:31 stop:1560 length:1530 start_codon:yes stop_codon:yes gene_type:complete
MTSKIVVNNLEPDSGISTVTVIGDCQATKFKGDGSNLTGIDATTIKHTDGNVKIQANNSGAVVTGILTVTKNADSKTIITGSSVGIGTTNTAGRNAGVGTATGTLIFNTDSVSPEFYNGNEWVPTNLIPFLNSLTGFIYNGTASNLIINASNISSSVSVRYSNNSTGAVIATDASPSISGSNITSAVPSAVYGTSAGTVVKIQIINEDGTSSSNFLTKTIINLPSGGTITSAGGYRYHTFNSSGNFVNTIASLSAEFLLVAGGGGGGSGDDGTGGGTGGGAGGAIDGTATLSAATFAIVIGAGGSGGKRVNGPEGTQGGDSTFNSNTAIGGGRGVDYGGTAHPGGVGTGGDIPNAFSGGSGAGAFRSGNPGAGTSGQGNSGGYGGGYNVGSPTAMGGGGGGGKGSVGGNAGSGNGPGGNGGTGINWKSLGTFYAGGGGGGGDNTSSGTGTAGTGTNGGGNGTAGGTGSNNSNHATANRGGGGGGTGANTGTFYQGSNGGSGICIIRYQL